MFRILKSIVRTFDHSFDPVLFVLLLAGIFSAADVVTSSVDTATLVSLLWGIVSVVLFQAIPLKGGWITVITYLAPFAVCAVAVLIVDNGFSGWSWLKFLIDVGVTYGANQALFNGGKVTGVLKP